MLRTAIRMADEGGIESLSMRKLGQELEVEAMALYHHFTNKDELLDGIVDLVFSEIERPAPGTAWRTAMRRRAGSVREALDRHSWAVGVIGSRRNAGPASLGHHDAVMGNLLAAGFDMPMAAFADALLDSYVYGFALTRQNVPFAAADQVVDGTHVEPLPAPRFPHLARFTEHALAAGHDFEGNFDFGLELILNGLEQARAAR